VLGVFAVLGIAALLSHLRFIKQSPVFPPHEVKAMTMCPVEPNDIVGVSYNIRMLPPVISSASQEHNMGRTAAIVDALRRLDPKPDVIFFQEAWDPRVREMLVAWLAKDYQFVTDTGAEDEERGMLCAVGTGLMVMSRFPIVGRYFQRFGVAALSSADFFADKGILRVTLDIAGEHVDVVNLHLQAGDFSGVRREQLSIVEGVLKGADLIVGDFNFDGREHLDFLVEYSSFYDTQITSQAVSSDVWQGQNPRLLDYVFSTKAMVGTCSEVIRGVYQSDHSPIRFRFNPGLKLE